MLGAAEQTEVDREAQHQLDDLDEFQDLLDVGDSLLARRGVGAKDQDRHIDALVQNLLAEGALEVAAPPFGEVGHKPGQISGALVDRQVLGDGHAGKLAYRALRARLFKSVKG
ncbi:hypothetical protein D9M69_483780 [compost metagenome]